MNPTDSLESALADLDSLASAGRLALDGAGDLALLEAARIEFLGQKQGRLKSAQERLKALEPTARKAYGQRFNLVKGELEALLEASRARLAAKAQVVDGIDVALPGIRPVLGHRHPLTQATEELTEIFGRFGFAVARGPEVEDLWHNFDALNIPQSHPARDPIDNFYLSSARGGAGLHERPWAMLRSQTSTVQIRVMESQPPPVRIIAIGRVYRPDTVDATHSFMFHQIEGLMVQKGVTMADLKSVLSLFARAYLGEDVKIRFRPSFFPFTEPSVEVDMLWHGKARWVEMGGAGMVDPNVLRAVGYEPEEVSGFAFGLGIERLCMRRHGIDDIRLLYQNDVGFLRQF